MIEPWSWLGGHPIWPANLPPPPSSCDRTRAWHHFSIAMRLDQMDMNMTLRYKLDLDTKIKVNIFTASNQAVVNFK